MKGILLVAIGTVEQRVLTSLKSGLEKTFRRPTEIGLEMPEPAYAYVKKRNQYLATLILEILENHVDDLAFERLLGITEHDLFVPELNFVFGIAGQRAALISLTRLRQEFYGLPDDPHLFERRVLTEAVHELGHTYGLGHCKNPRCVMFFSNSLADTDQKGPEFCPKCRLQLSDHLLKPKT